MRRHQQSSERVHRRHGQLTRSEQGKHDDQRQKLPARAGDMSICSETRSECAREQRNRPEVQRQREPSSDFSQSRENGNFDTGRAFQLRKPVVDQVEADVRRSIVAPSCAAQVSSPEA